jgi:hypothetical protein
MSRETDTMTCRRAFDVDLVACLLDRSRPEWEAFRDHYPTCPDCAAEVRAWTELQAELAPAHPAPARLLRYQDEPTSLPAEERHAIRDHVAVCAPCRDELHMLRTTDLPALVRAGTAASAPAGAPLPARRPRRGRRGIGGRLRALLWHPAFAYALVLLLVVPALLPTLAPRRDVARPGPAAPAEPGAAVVGREAREGAAPMAARKAATPEAYRPLAEQQATPSAEGRAASALADRAAARSRVDQAAPASPPVWPRLDMTPGSSQLVVAASPGLILALPVPGDAATAGAAELRIHDAADRRELREEHFGPPTRRVTMRVPAGWLEPGRYVVELWLGDTKPAVTATLDVAARSAAN